LYYCSHLHHDYAFSMGKHTNLSPFVLIPTKYLYIIKQWHKQWGEGKMIEKEETRLKTHELISNTGLVCLLCSEPIQKLSFSFVIYMISLLCCSIVHWTIVLKLFDMFYRFVFNLGGQSPSYLIIRDWPLPRFQSKFR